MEVKKKNRRHFKVNPFRWIREVGRNMTLLEYKNSILIIDMGFRMPEETMPGIDYIIPDLSYLLENKRYKNVVGFVITHGHYDHVGAIPYIWNRIGNPPIYAAPLTKGIILKRQDEFKDQPKLDVNEVKDGSKIKLGVFEIEF